MDAIDAFDREVTAALMRVAAREGWSNTTLAEVAREAGTTLAALRPRFRDRSDVLNRFGMVIDATVLAGTPPLNEADTVKDRLFDILMRRFDALAPHRAGVLEVWRAMRRDPLFAAARVPPTILSMRWMLEAAGVPSSGPTGLLRAHALFAVWLSAFRAWETDETPDMAPTMAALDKGLTRAESLAETVEPWLGGRAFSPPPPPETPRAPLGAASEPSGV